MSCFVGDLAWRQGGYQALAPKLHRCDSDSNDGLDCVGPSVKCRGAESARPMSSTGSHRFLNAISHLI